MNKEKEVNICNFCDKEILPDGEPMQRVMTKTTIQRRGLFHEFFHCYDGDGDDKCEKGLIAAVEGGNDDYIIEKPDWWDEINGTK